MNSRLVLVADDDADTVEAYGLLFRSRGHQVETATDGPSVLVKARELRPDLIVLDIGLPLMDGREVLRRLREPAVPRIPVLVLTGHAAATVVAAAVDLGADHVMIKPCDPRELCERVESLLNGAPGGSTTGDEPTSGEPEAGRIRAPKPRYRRRVEVLPVGCSLLPAGAEPRMQELKRAAAALQRQARVLRRQARLAHARAIAIRAGQATRWGWRFVVAPPGRLVSD